MVSYDLFTRTFEILIRPGSKTLFSIWIPVGWKYNLSKNKLMTDTWNRSMFSETSGQRSRQFDTGSTGGVSHETFRYIFTSRLTTMLYT